MSRHAIPKTDATVLIGALPALSRAVARGALTEAQFMLILRFWVTLSDERGKPPKQEAFELVLEAALRAASNEEEREAVRLIMATRHLHFHPADVIYRSGFGH